MKKHLTGLVVLLSLMLGGCATLVEGEVRGRNDRDLQKRKITPQEYQKRNEEIDRNFR